jgi:uncharacterized secreted protein with C-terminal beta-propeller domain
MLALFALAACTQVTNPPTDTKTTQTAFSTPSQLNTWLAEHQGSQYNYYNPRFLSARAEAAPSKAGAGSIANDYSQTNNQVTGIDEADTFKTDGNYIYTISNNQVKIINAYPAESAEIVATLNYTQYPQALFINGDYLYVIANEYDGAYSFGQTQSTKMYKYDVSNKDNIKLTQTFDFEGYFSQGRLINGTVYLITNAPGSDRPIPMPYYKVGGVESQIAIDRISIMPYPYDYATFTNVYKITNDDVESSSVITNGNPTVYMSNTAIYLATGEYINSWKYTQNLTMQKAQSYTTSEDITVINKINAADLDVVSQVEKEQKIYNVYLKALARLTTKQQEQFQKEIQDEVDSYLESLESMEYTNIVKIDALSLTTIANAKVPGSIINQFALHEHQNTVVVATTQETRWMTDKIINSTNNVFVLNTELQKTGEIKNIAQGERIYSSRFVGDQLYLVTFRQIDPFFVIDFSDVEKPKLLGELKITGYSNYLHPINDHVILGFGQETDKNGRVTGLKMTLFDVTNPSQPTEINSWVDNKTYAYSQAQYDYKAFLYADEKDLLVIPVSSWDYTTSQSYSGAYVFNVTEDSIELRGLIGSGDYYSSVQRSAYINDMLYTVSYSQLRINRLSDLIGVKNISLAPALDIKVY